ncbi:hypothetical protein E4T39_06377 [Aureobasidium subglaciale]|nr:hypothetical protein E4T39_06377 [Aureobasidium subglaciale]
MYLKPSLPSLFFFLTLLISLASSHTIEATSHNPATDQNLGTDRTTDPDTNPTFASAASDYALATSAIYSLFSSAKNANGAAEITDISSLASSVYAAATSAVGSIFTEATADVGSVVSEAGSLVSSVDSEVTGGVGSFVSEVTATAAPTTDLYTPVVVVSTRISVPSTTVLMTMPTEAVVTGSTGVSEGRMRKANGRADGMLFAAVFAAVAFL